MNPIIPGGPFHAPGGDLNSPRALNTFFAFTAETGQASKAAATAYAATSGLINIYNRGRSSTASPDNNIVVPRMIRLTAKAANTSATDFRLHMYLDDGDRYVSGGAALTPVTFAHDEPATYADRVPKARINVGDLTLAAATGSVKKLGHFHARSAVFAIGDQVEIWFGTAPSASSDSANLDRTVIVVPPVFIGRNQNLSIHEVAASQAAGISPLIEVWFEEYGTAV